MLDFLILYEHKAREIDNICLLKAELELRGYSVDIVQVGKLNVCKYKLWRKPKVVVTPHLYDDPMFERCVYSFAGKIKKVVNLQWEQVLSKMLLESKHHMPKDIAASATHICWGEDSYHDMRKCGIKNAIITGAVSLDFLQGKLINTYMSRLEVEKKYSLPKKKMILYISSFVFATIRDDEKSAWEQATKLSFNDVVETNKLSREKTLQYFERLLETYADMYIVYRPHPGENIDDRLRLIELKYSNFFIIAEESIKQWILAADEIITWISTAITEVYYAGKTCIILRPYKLPDKNDAVIYKNARVISEYDELVGELNHKNRNFPIPAEDFEVYYGNKFDEPAYVKVCNLLETVRNTDKYDICYKKNVFFAVVFKYSVKRIIKMVILALHITDKTWPFSKIRKVADWLAYYLNIRAKDLQEMVSKKELDDKTYKLKKILQAAKAE